MTIAGTGSHPIAAVTINELSTVASAYAFAQFLNGTSLAGPALSLQTAAATALNLIAPSTGTAASTIGVAPNGSATEALATFNTLAGVLSSCTQTASLCPGPFSQAAPLPGGKTATDTLQAQNIALAPGQNVPALFCSGAGIVALQADARRRSQLLDDRAEILACVCTGAVAFDAVGNIWITDNFNPGTTAPGQQITALNSAGAPTLGSPIVGGGIDGPSFGIAVDPAGQVWIGNGVGNSLSVFNAGGQAISGSTFIAGNLNKPRGLAVDQSGNVWIPNLGNNTLTEYQRANFSAALTFSGNGLSTLAIVAIDANGTVWVSDTSGLLPEGAVSAFAATGTPMPFSPISGGGISDPEGMPVDSSGNVWVSNFAGRNVTVIGNTGSILSPSPLRAASSFGP